MLSSIDFNGKDGFNYRLLNFVVRHQ